MLVEALRQSQRLLTGGDRIAKAAQDEEHKGAVVEVVRQEGLAGRAKGQVGGVGAFQGLQGGFEAAEAIVDGSKIVLQGGQVAPTLPGAKDLGCPGGGVYRRLIPLHVAGRPDAGNLNQGLAQLIAEPGVECQSLVVVVQRFFMPAVSDGGHHGLQAPAEGAVSVVVAQAGQVADQQGAALSGGGIGAQQADAQLLELLG